MTIGKALRVIVRVAREPMTAEQFQARTTRLRLDWPELYEQIIELLEPADDHEADQLVTAHRALLILRIYADWNDVLGREALADRTEQLDADWHELNDALQGLSEAFGRV